MRQKSVTDPAYEEVNNAFERALVFMHKVRGRGREGEGEGEKVSILCVTDAQDMAGLQPVPHGPEKSDKDTSYLRPGAPGPPSHPAPQDLASLHQVCTHPRPP